MCKVAKLEETTNQENYKPIIIAFGLDEDVLETIPYILQCSQGILFTTLWDKKGNEVAKQKQKELDMDEILEEVWAPTYQFWNDLCKRLKSGDLKFSEFEKYFSRTANMETLRVELERLSGDGDKQWVDVRLDQLRKYRSLRNCLFGAEVIMDVVKEYELKGNFTQIGNVLSLVS